MEYRVEEIARAADVSVDTVRFYQSRGLLPAPERRGRVAIYGDAHLDRLQRIRALNRQGLTLDAVRRVLDRADNGNGVRESLLGALGEAEGPASYSRSELAASAGLPELLIDLIERSGLLEPVEVDGRPRYTAADLGTLQAARRVLDGGFPVEEILPLALEHAQHVGDVAERAIELFERFVRHDEQGRERDPEAVKAAFHELLPAVTTLVALHFQRTVVGRARARLTSAGDTAGLAAALDATERARIDVTWTFPD